jgi:uncharacterized protein with NRDE domain
MCTILAWKDVHPRWPLIIAANRDEFEGRESTGPQVLDSDPIIIGGRDEVAGGTWLAVSERGVLAAIANRRGAGEHDAKKRSRGTLVIEAARAANVAGAKTFASNIDPATYNPFILLVADATYGFVAHAGDDGLRLAELSAGAHAITNWDLDSTKTSKAARALRIAQRTRISDVKEPAALARLLHHVLSDHAEGPGGLDGGLCVHRPAREYGTRSSWIVVLGSSPRETCAYYIEGHPCEGEPSDVTHVLRGVAA